AGYFANAVGSEVETDAGVFVANGAQSLTFCIGADKRHDELIGHAFVVRLFHSLDRVGVLAGFTIAENHGIVCLGNALPAAIAIHGVIASADGRDLACVVLA